MAINPAERVEATAVKTTESATLAGQQISAEDNRTLAEVRTNNASNLKAAGVLPELAITNDLELVQKNFKGIDASQDGHVIKEEIDDYIKNHKELKPEESAALQRVGAQIGKLEESSNDEWGDENDGGSSAYGDLRPALDYAQKNFKQMDADGDGYISAVEIDQYMQKNTLSIEEMQNLRALKQKVGDIEELSNDEWGDENNGISMKDIAAAKEQIDTLAYAQKNLDKLDGNGDGHVTEDEIEGYIRAKGNDISPDELRKLEALKKAVGDLEEKHNDEWGDENDGFTRHDLVDALNELGSAGVRDGNPNAQKPENGANPENREKPGPKPEDGKKPGENPAVGDHEYVVQKGDSLWKISKENLRAQTGKEPTNAEILKAVHELAKANNMKETDIILPGKTKLRVPGPEHGATQPKPEQKPEQRPEQRKPASEVLRSRFSEIDNDGNNHVTKREIQDYIARHQKDLTVAEQKALDLMAKNEDTIENFANDQTGPEHGISRQDLDKLDQLQRGSAEMLNTGHFDSFDKNHNGFLNKDEIAKALTNERLSREERLTLEFLRDNMKLLGRGNNDQTGFDKRGITLADMRHYAGLI